MSWVDNITAIEGRKNLSFIKNLKEQQSLIIIMISKCSNNYKQAYILERFLNAKAQNITPKYNIPNPHLL